ncbi:MAG: ATP-binding protein, partial [Planctomycetota bacterium]
HRWMSADAIDLDGLLTAFQQFWRENADIWTTKYDYREAAPHLILMAYLQRVINGGAYIAREFATGRKRLDLDIQYAGRHYPIELKLYYGPKTRPDGEAQLAAYCQSLGACYGWLIIFDRREDRSWDDKISWEEVTVDGVRLRVLGC